MFVKYFTHKSTSSFPLTVLNHEIAVSVQEFLGKLNVASDSKDELFQIACQGILNNRIVGAMHIDTPDNGHIYDRQASVNRDFLHLLPEHVHFLLDVAVFHPKCLYWARHQTVHICHEEGQTRAPHSLKHGLWEESCR